METPQIVALVMIGIIILEFLYGSYLKRKKRRKLLEEEKKNESEEI